MDGPAARLLAAREDVAVGSWDHARVGIPVTLASVGAALAVLLAERALHLF